MRAVRLAQRSTSVSARRRPQTRALVGARSLGTSSAAKLPTTQGGTVFKPDTVDEPSLFQRVMASFNRRSNMRSVPLDEPWEHDDRSLPKSLAETSDVEITKLKSGVTVLSRDMASPLTSVGLFFDAGSRYEYPGQGGHFHFLETMAFASNHRDTSLELVRKAGSIGGSLMGIAGRENMQYHADVLREHADIAVDLLLNMASNKSFLQREVDAQIQEFEYLFAEKAFQPDVDLADGILSAAYRNNTLGVSLIPSPDLVQSMSASSLNLLTATFHRPERMVVSAVGIEHQRIVNSIQAALEDLHAISPPEQLTPEMQALLEKAPAKYTGGETRIQDSSLHNAVHVAVGFETVSASHDDVVPLCVLQLMLGGGGSFSAGGPGKGLYSRLYVDALNTKHWLQSCTSFAHFHSDSSVFGIMGSASEGEAGELVELLTSQCKKMAGKPSAEELSRAKAALKSSVLMHLESRPMIMEDIGRQMLSTGKIDSISDVIARIDKVSAADIQRVSEAMLSTPLSLSVAAANPGVVPSYDAVSQMLK